MFAEYTGKLASTGAVFDSNVGKNKPFKFVIGEKDVIAGWDEGFGLRAGDEAQLRIPSAMGYAEGGVEGHIPPNSDLIFDVKVLGLMTAAETVAARRKEALDSFAPALLSSGGAAVVAGKKSKAAGKGVLEKEEIEKKNDK